ncbi:hypothetical protein niasHT_010298 [Heterodera trifolii]|uniref:Tubulin-specific chaperone E n=1 Tax=Heterodera trifolii TaxID=157864 RepID=A0ABD2M5V6_9BILA
MSAVEINQRVVLNGSKGVVRYLGPVEGTAGQWVGVDWDDPTRGKHDGRTRDGRRYFTATAASSASFVREQCLHTGDELFSAICAKYATEGDDDDKCQNETIEAGDKVRWQLVNMDKVRRAQRDVFRLRCIVLSWSLVSHLDVSKLGDRTFANCAELDLTETLVGKWTQICDILARFPALRIFHLNDNRIEWLEESAEEEGTFGRIKHVLDNCRVTHLSMNRCKLNEQTANLLTALFPRLEEIYLANNGLDNYAPAGDCAGLRLVDLQQNPPIGTQIDAKCPILTTLSHLPNLNYLNVSSCALQTLNFGDGNGFCALKTLILQDNPISLWESVDGLARLPALAKLILRGAPLPGARGVDSREMIIAKLPQITDLDRCDVSPVARRSAELLFLSRFGADPVTVEHAATVARLATIYSIPNDGDPSGAFSVPRPAQPLSTIHSKRVRLEHAGRSMERSLSLALPIHKIVGLGARLFGFAPDTLKGVELRRADPAYPSELLCRTRDNLLRQFDIDDGDVLAFV